MSFARLGICTDGRGATFFELDQCIHSNGYLHVLILFILIFSSIIFVGFVSVTHYQLCFAWLILLLLSSNFTLVNYSVLNQILFTFWFSSSFNLKVFKDNVKYQNKMWHSNGMLCAVQFTNVINNINENYTICYKINAFN